MVARLSSKPKLPPLTEDRIKPVPKPATGTATVVVGCKLPNGILLRQFRMVKRRRVVAGQTFDEEMSEEVGHRHVVRGPAMGFGIIPNIKIVAGFALTEGVPRDLCEVFFKQNEDAEFIRNQLLFWEPNVDRAADRARELQKLKTGFEPADPNNPQAAFAARGLSKITKADLSDSDMGKT
jgi:hypothetical protein